MLSQNIKYKELNICNILENDENIVIRDEKGDILDNSNKIYININKNNGYYMLGDVVNVLKKCSIRDKKGKFFIGCWNVFCYYLRRKYEILLENIEINERDRENIEDWLNIRSHACCVSQIYYMFNILMKRCELEKDNYFYIEGWEERLDISEGDVENIIILIGLFDDVCDFCLPTYCYDNNNYSKTIQWIIKYLHLNDMDTYTFLNIPYEDVPWIIDNTFYLPINWMVWY